MKLADWRVAQGYTQQQLADLLACSLASVCRYEAGTRMPEPDMKRKIFVLSEGAVTPNDFHDLAAWRKLFARIGQLLERDAA